MSEPVTLQDLINSVPVANHPESSQKLLLFDSDGSPVTIKVANLNADHHFSLDVTTADAGKWVRLGSIPSTTGNIFHVALEHGAGGGASCCLSLVVSYRSTQSATIRQLSLNPANYDRIPKLRIAISGIRAYLDFLAGASGYSRVDFFGMTETVNTSEKGILPDSTPADKIIEFVTSELPS